VVYCPQVALAPSGVEGMRCKGLGLVELLVAIAVGVMVMGGAFLALRQAAQSLPTEQKIALSRDQAARVLQGLSGELKDRPAAFLLPGASESGAGLVVLSGTGWPVIAQEYGPNRVRITGGRPDLQAGTPVALVSPTGEVFYNPGLGGVTAVNTGAGVYELNFWGCPNPLRFVQGMRVYRAELLTVAKVANGLQIRGTNLGAQQVLTLKDFTFRYIYASPMGETASRTYQGASLSDGSRLVALAFQATGTTEADRAYTARLPLGIGTVEVRRVVMCGDSPPPPPGTCLVTVVINPAPPGGGDVTLFASGGYTQTIRETTTFRDVPAGDVMVRGEDVWTDSLTAWAPNPRSQSGICYNFAPLTLVVSYSVVPATLQVEVTPPFQGTIRLLGLPGNPRVSSPRGSVQVRPGQYTVTGESPLGGVSPEGCRTRYVGETPPQAVTLRSYETHTLPLQYRPESGCLNITVKDRSPNNALMSAGYKPTVRFKKVP